MNAENQQPENLKPEESEIIKELKDKLDFLQKERDEYLNGWKRAKADLINYQKDEAKRFDELLKFGSIDIIKDLIPVLDSFDLSLSVLEKQGKAEKGVYMIRAQMEDVLKKRGLEKISVMPGQKFDPSIHESISEGESEYPIGSVFEVIEHGYSLNGRVVRPTRVKLSKGK